MICIQLECDTPIINGQYCKQHNKIINNCKQENCNSGARYNSDYCTKHGGGKRCQEKDCIKSAQGKTDYCVKHGGGKRCQEKDCISGAQSNSNYCTKHGGKKKCKELNCQTHARDNTEYCKKHGGGKRCQEKDCISGAIGKTDYCKKHGGGKKCNEPDCKTSARPASNYCILHGGGKRCPNCINWIDSRAANNKYDGYCATCFKRLYPADPRSTIIYEHTKEIRVRNAINEHFNGFIHDHSLYTGNCDCSHRRRIDHRKLIGNTILAIETDEFAHKDYDQKDEDIRYDDLYMIYSGKWIYIRFNPDKTKENKVDIEDRITLLLEVIKQQIYRIENEENIELVEIIKLFY